MPSAVQCGAQRDVDVVCDRAPGHAGWHRAHDPTPPRDGADWPTIEWPEAVPVPPERAAGIRSAAEYVRTFTDGDKIQQIANGLDALADLVGRPLPAPPVAGTPGVCGQMLTGIAGVLLVCDLDAGHAGWHRTGPTSWGSVVAETLEQVGRSFDAARDLAHLPDGAPVPELPQRPIYARTCPECGSNDLPYHHHVSCSAPSMGDCPCHPAPRPERDGRLDAVRELVSWVRPGRASTHSEKCYQWHAGCLALAVQRVLDGGAP